MSTHLVDAPAPPPHATAQRATLQAFLNCYLREVNPGVLLPAPAYNGGQRLLEIPLPERRMRLRITLEYHSLTGPHRISDIRLRHDLEDVWQIAAPVEALTLLVQDTCRRHGGGPNCDGMATLLHRILESNGEIGTLCAHRCGRNDTGSRDFLSAERALVFGHWLHPTPKSRDGMTGWQARAYAPEFCGSFQLRFLAVERSLMRSGSSLGRDAEALVREVPGIADRFEIEANEALLPVHPLQMEALRLDPEIETEFQRGRLRDLGAAGCRFAATSSVRTLYAPECPWMLKFSLPVRITNSLRTNLRHELAAGVVMSRLIRRLDFHEVEPRFRIIDDPAWLTVERPNRAESGFEVIFRQNPFLAEAGSPAGFGIVNIAALTAEPLPGQTSMLSLVVDDLARTLSETAETAALRWFDAYLDCMLRPILTLFERHGIALEAHQQNILLDISGGVPSRCYFRDNQGYYVAESRLTDLAEIAPGIGDIAALSFPDGEIHERLCYYLVVNQIFAVISRLGAEGLAPEALLVDRLAAILEEAASRYPGPGGDFARFVLLTPHLSAKANLLTRLHGIDELEAPGEKAVYVRLPNPVSARRTQAAAEEHTEVARARA
ncbi:IucA/IucC family protein [Amaricoccus macauensis]|uniref:IucA/IucC family protein n=1 Tax=Amaricoccus macauensis TaxID=57001 RepID=UPI003C7EBB2A